MNHDVKFLQIRDRGTNIPALAININPATLEDNSQGKREVAIVRRAGFGYQDHIQLTRLADSETHYDPFEWRGAPVIRTMHTAHLWLEKNWHSVKSGDVVCVETICGERETPKEFET